MLNVSFTPKQAEFIKALETIEPTQHHHQAIEMCMSALKAIMYVADMAGIERRVLLHALLVTGKSSVVAQMLAEGVIEEREADTMLREIMLNDSDLPSDDILKQVDQILKKDPPSSDA